MTRLNVKQLKEYGFELDEFETHEEFESLRREARGVNEREHKIREKARAQELNKQRRNKREERRW